jgi:hypothetical protein
MAGKTLQEILVVCTIAMCDGKLVLAHSVGFEISRTGYVVLVRDLILAFPHVG